MRKSAGALDVILNKPPMMITTTMVTASGTTTETPHRDQGCAGTA